MRNIGDGHAVDGRVLITDQIVVALQFVGEWESTHPRISWHKHKQVSVHIPVVPLLMSFFVTVRVEKELNFFLRVTAGLIIVSEKANLWFVDFEMVKKLNLYQRPILIF